ncbi:MAG TPA: hypothetical protein VMZ91_16210 [Candidatus Paceibacterota bacterium]|nr:hypothetical protein [Candidatus Paceibacterota bacterium]
MSTKGDRKNYLRVEKKCQYLWTLYKDENIIKILEKISKDGVSSEKEHLLAISACNYILSKQIMEKMDKSLLEKEFD